MPYIDYYSILGVSKTATQDEIKKAYKKMARKHHPDLNPNDKDAQRRFQELNEANEVLGDPEKRKKYDQYGENWKNADAYEAQKQQYQRQGSAGGGGGHWEFSGDAGEYSDFFESLFGGMGGGRSSGRTGRGGFRGQDLNAELHLSFREAAETHKRVLTVNGKNIRITIPAGVENGQTIKLKGQGSPGMNGGVAGDLYITFAIPEDPVFKRLGNDLYITVVLDLYTAILGGEQLIETLDGKVKLKVQPETQNGTKVRLKGKGFPVYKKEGQFGDLIVTWNIELPTKLTDKQKELFEALRKEASTQN
ncbi:J domain-containing protein [Porphyromonadaceae bacterium OttesenSCG-928-L07]|nr:J domain-containing protein [Porphyromonadaceae bacterium OttesenSCG-928-L07]MDL2251240.1 J domain-containing protein [Odoribacter sp. OttesenSCG-928-J03]